MALVNLLQVCLEKTTCDATTKHLEVLTRELGAGVVVKGEMLEVGNNKELYASVECPSSSQNVLADEFECIKVN